MTDSAANARQDYENAVIVYKRAVKLSLGGTHKAEWDAKKEELDTARATLDAAVLALLVEAATEAREDEYLPALQLAQELLKGAELD